MCRITGQCLLWNTVKQQVFSDSKLTFSKETDWRQWHTTRPIFSKETDRQQWRTTRLTVSKKTDRQQWHITRLTVSKGNRLRALTYIFHWFPPEECREWWSPAPGACLCGYCWNSTLAVPAWSRESPTLRNKGGFYFPMLHRHHNL